jgi:hypothetical protein
MDGDRREGEIMEKLMILKTKLRDYTDYVVHIRIDNFYTNNVGINKAASFMITK